MLICSGASLTFAFAPYGQWYLPFMVLPVSFYLISRYADKIFIAAWMFGFGYFSAGIAWVHVSIAEFGGIPLVASLFLMFLLCAYLALFPAMAFYLTKRFFPIRPMWPLVLPFIWLISEWARAHLLTGFPWLSIGYSQSTSMLSAWLPIIGEIGLSALIILVCISIAIGIQYKKVISIIPIVVLFVSSFVLQNVQWTKQSDQSKSVLLVQGNIAQSMRWDPKKDEQTIRHYLALTEPYWDADIVVWPEAAIPKLEIGSGELLVALDQRAIQSQTGFITGIVDYNIETKVALNLLLAMGIDNEQSNTPYQYGHKKRFAKHHLLPIGEFVPFEDLLRPLAPIFDLPMSSFTRGEYVQDNLLVNETYFAPAICFEIAFPKQIRANLQPHTNAIITVSNDAWFGDSHGPHQHMQIAQVRAREFGLPLLRATNNGVTGTINSYGQITASLPQFESGVLTSTLHFSEGFTPYRKFGDLPVWIVTAMLFFIALIIRYKGQSN
ncbi:apolipoprotein N-acyltransferase [Glaciecola petra]|uniref:Apolipoprotein N-acyltransferase n=1 Tax=Glaciecola petra TaxID=3075602 RepID=A0ABU2ZMY7_9ALTE|nr:apolipoprotein N-acyltransferase [Aestuariibacter sp. P117]MDT0593985.1 apolipoprotein N-acyltransferase [Aestuariibacter sp. P117]